MIELNLVMMFVYILIDFVIFCVEFCVMLVWVVEVSFNIISIDSDISMFDMVVFVFFGKVLCMDYVVFEKVFM